MVTAHMVTALFAPALRPLVVALLLSVTSAACSEPAPILLQPLAPGVMPTHRTSQGRPAPGVRPLMNRARWIVADGAHRGLAASRESARVIEHVERTQTPPDSEAPIDSAPRAPSDTPSRRPVDVNSAPVEALDTLPGVGPAIAARIVEARPYGTLDDLQRVRGIGPATLERIRPHAVVHAVGR